MSFSENLRVQLDRIASVPPRTEVLERIAARSAPELGDPVAELTRARAGRTGA